MKDKESEIRLQFLEESTQYLNTIDLVLNGSAGSRLDKKGIDDVVRAAHSIKGGAAMVGLQTLSNMALHLEDFFKVFKTQPQRPIEPQLEGLLLAIIDRMREVSALNFEGEEADEKWLDCFVNPSFSHLQKFLGGNTTPEAPVALLENDQDVVRMIFETEVEGCLQRLESELAKQDNSCLLEESIVAAQELGGLGEMLNLTEFSSLCESITRQLEANPTRVEEITRLALQEWRRSQAALLVGQPDAQPSPTTEHNAITSPNDIQFDTINLYDSSEPNRTYLTSLEHKLGCEGVVCIPSEQLQQINLVFGKLTEQHQRNAEQLQLNAAYLEQLGSLLEKLNHDTHSQLTTHNHKVSIGFSNGVGGLDLEDEPSAITATTSQKHTILVVDDSRTVRQALSLTLEKAGYDVKSAEDGLDALKQLLAGLQVGAIICDLDMPHLDGYGLLTRLKSDPALKHFPIAMLTSHVENERRQKAMLLGAAAYFTKPYNAQELLRTLKELIK